MLNAARSRAFGRCVGKCLLILGIKTHITAFLAFELLIVRVFLDPR